MEVGIRTPDFFEHHYLVVVISSGQSLESIRVEPAARGVQLLPVVFGQLGAEGVDRDDKSSEKAKIFLSEFLISNILWISVSFVTMNSKKISVQ